GSGKATSFADQLGNVPAFIKQFGASLDHWVQQSSAHPDQTVIAIAIWTIPVIMALRSLFAYLNTYLAQWCGAHTVADLRTRLFEHLQNLSLGFFDTARTGELISRITSDTQALHMTISLSAPSLVRDPLMVLALLALLLSQQPKLTLISMIVFPLCVV